MKHSKSERVYLAIAGWLLKMKREGKLSGNVVEISDGIKNLLILEGVL